MTKIIINGVIRDMTSAEEAEIADAHAKAIANKKIRTDALEVKKTNKTSAQNKLKALGLTDAEIEAL